MRGRTLARGLGWASGILLGLLLLAAVVVWFALSNEWAAQRLVAAAVKRTPALVRVGQVKGELAGPLELRNVVIRTDALSAQVDRVLLEWRPTALLRRRVELEQVHISGVRVLLADSVPEEPDTLAKPRERIVLPVEVLLGDVRVERVAVDAPGGIELRGGELGVTGRAQNYSLRLGATISTPAVQKVKLNAAAHGDLDRLTLDSMTAALLDGLVAAEGRLRWWPEIGWDLALAGKALRPALLLSDPAAWPGTLSFSAGTEGVLDSSGPAARVVLDTLSGVLRGQSVGGALAVTVDGERYAIPKLALSWGSARLGASGLIGESLDVAFDISIPRLGVALPGATGSLSARGTASGPRDSARIQAGFAGRNLRYKEHRLARLSGRADVGLAPDGRTDLDLRGGSAEVAGRRIDQVVVVARGTRTGHRLRARVEAPQDTVRLAVEGGIGEDGFWSGTIRALDLRSELAGDWRLAGPTALSAGPAAAELDTLCLRSGDEARFCAAGAWRESGGWRAASSMRDVPLSLAAAFLPVGWSAEGTLDGSAAGSVASNGRLQADVALVPRRAALAYSTDSVTERIAVERGKLELHAGRQGVNGALTLTLSRNRGEPVGTLSGAAELPDYTRVGQVIERQRVAGRVEARLADLGSLRPFTDSLETLAGSVALDLSAEGTVRSPHVTGRLDMTELAVRHLAGWAARGSLAADLDAKVGADRSLTAEARIRPRDVAFDLPGDTVPGSVVVDTAAVDLRAGADGVEGRIVLALASAAGRPFGTVSGELALPEYTTLGEELSLQPVRVRLEGLLPDLGAFLELAPAGTLTALSGNAGLDLRVGGSVGAPEVAGELRVRDARAVHARGWAAAGSLAADLDGALARDSTFSAELQILPIEATFEYPDDRGRQRLTVDTGAVHLRGGPGGVGGSLALRLANGAGESVGWMDGTLALPGYTRLGQEAESLRLKAGIKGRFDDLSFVDAVTDRVDSVTGRVALDVDVDGTLAKPEVVGGVSLEDGGANLPALGLRLRELNFEAKGDRGGVIALAGRVRSGPGRLAIEGTMPVEPSAGQPARLSIRGERFEAMNLAEARVLISPELEVAVTGDKVEVKGEVQVPFARIELAEIPATAVPVSGDVVFVDSTATAAPALDIAAQVRVALGDSVSFKGFNFTAELGGSILAVERPGSQPTASGELVIEQGRYKAYGQDLSISQGRVLFGGGPVDDPGLDIRATRTADDGVVAGLDIAGTLKAPEVTIFSEPPMAQSEALAYIVLGRPLGESGPSEDGTLVAKAAQSLGLRGGNLLVRTLGRGVGLDEARLETEGDLSEASFVAGKYLSPNLYVSYGIGLFEPVSTLRLRYVLSSHWTLQAETGRATGTDLLYRIEVGR